MLDCQCDHVNAKKELSVSSVPLAFGLQLRVEVLVVCVRHPFCYPVAAGLNCQCDRVNDKKKCPSLKLEVQVASVMPSVVVLAAELPV